MTKPRNSGMPQRRGRASVNTSTPRPEKTTAVVVDDGAAIVVNNDVGVARTCPHAVSHALTDDARQSAEMMRDNAHRDGLFVLADFMADRLAPCVDDMATVTEA